MSTAKIDPRKDPRTASSRGGAAYSALDAVRSARQFLIILFQILKSNLQEFLEVVSSTRKPAPMPLTLLAPGRGTYGSSWRTFRGTR